MLASLTIGCLLGMLVSSLPFRDAIRASRESRVPDVAGMVGPVFDRTIPRDRVGGAWSIDRVGPDAPLSLSVHAFSVEPFEDRLSAGTTNFFKTARTRIRRTAKLLRWSVKRWAGWTVRGIAFLFVALLAPLLDRALLTTWREGGWRGLRTAVVLGLAVYVRLLLDRNAPVLGKLLIAAAIVYGIASRDLLPDAGFPLGAVDDVIAVVLASRCFMLLCPEPLVEVHAVQAARARDRLLEWQRSRMLPPVG